MSAIEQPAAGSSGSNALKFIGCGCLALIVIGLLGVIGLAFGFTKLMKNNEPYRDSVAAVEANPEAAAALGTPVEPGFLPSGNISTTNGEGSVDLSIPVSGPNGKGTIKVVGTKASGATEWTYQTWELQIPGREAIPLSK